MMRSNYNHRARLVLGEPQAIYYAGQVLTGYIELEIQNPIQFSAINVTFHGSAHVRWTEIETAEYNGMQEMRKVEYNGGQDCLHYTQCLYGRVLPGRGEGVVDVQSLPPGEREIPFKFTLPKDIPSSFKSKRGQVTYNVTAYVEYLNHEMGRDELYHEFEVVAPMNLLENDIVRPLDMHFEEVYSCCCSSSPMSVDIKCPVSGYCPGQAIPINIKVKNESAVEVKKIVFQLLKKELYRSLEPPSEYTTPDEVLATVKTGAILSNSDKGFTCHLPIPPMIAPNMDNCDVIDIGFFLRAIIKMTGCNDDLEDEVLLFIGLKPIPGTPGSENYVHPLARNLPNGAPVSDAPLRANIEQVARPTSYPGQNVTPYPAENVNARPVQPLNSSYPGQNTPYPTASPRSAPNATSHTISSYPGQNLPPYPTSPNTSGPAPYPPKPVGFDALPHPIPTDYPNPTPPMPSSRSPYPPANSPYPPANSSHPSANSSYPPANSPYPPANSSHPSANSSYPPENSPYPPANSSHPSANSPYPPENSTYPPANSPYPPANSPRSPKNSPYPPANSPYPPANSPHPPTNSSYPTSTPPYPRTESMSMTPLRTQTLGFILPSGSPHPSAKDDDQNSPHTPLMQNHPAPSAPPPSN